MISNELTEGKGTISGLKIISPETGSNNVSAIRITPGRIIFQENPKNQIIIDTWNYGIEYLIKDNVVLDLHGATDNVPQFYSIYASPSNENLSEQTTRLKFKTVKGTPAENPPTPTEDSSDIFIGVVFIPSRFPATNTTLYYRSLADSETSYNLIVPQDEWVQSVTEKLESWQAQMIYFENQITRVGDCLYISQRNQASSDSFSNDLSDGMWVKICDSGGEAIQDKDYIMRIVQNRAPDGVKHVCIYANITSAVDLAGTGTADTTGHEVLMKTFSVVESGTPDYSYDD